MHHFDKPLTCVIVCPKINRSHEKFVDAENKVRMGAAATEMLLDVYMETESYSHVDKGLKEDGQGEGGTVATHWQGH